MMGASIAGISGALYAAAAFFTSLASFIAAVSARRRVKGVDKKIDSVHKLVNGRAEETEARLDSLEAKAQRP